MIFKRSLILVSSLSAFLYASRYVCSWFAISMYGSRVVLSKTPKYPRSMTVQMDFVTFSLACLRVRLNAPRLILALVSLNRAFSSYFNDLPAILSDNMSMRSVSSWVFVKWLLSAIILAIGSLIELSSNE